MPNAALIDPHVLLRMVRAATAFPALATLLQRLVDGPDGETTLPRLIGSVLNAGPDGLALQPYLVTAIHERVVAPPDAD